ncbi:nuclease HARBI1-like protein [Aphelenchoides avenae]|nr:nuclease HARBI1-like protein [Aphelenchus avenae]
MPTPSPSPSPGLQVRTMNVLEVDLESQDSDSDSDWDSRFRVRPRVPGLGLGPEVRTMRGHVLEDVLVDGLEVRFGLEVGLEVGSMHTDSGYYGKASDVGLFDSSDLKRAMDNGQLNLPDPEPVVNGGRVLPYFFVGDAAFPLSDRMMKPFPMTNGTDESRRLFNYRLCRARRVIENCFGLIAVKWRVLLTTIATRPETCDHIVKAVCALHNFVIDETPSGDAHPTAMADDGDDDNGRWRSEVPTLLQANIRRRGNNRPAQSAVDFRDSLIEYFVQEGAVQWQRRMIGIESDEEDDE